jgi:mannose-6-phosphate isomerase-like protein (cupin superfamily)
MYTSGEFVHYQFDPADISGGDDRTLPKLFEPGAGMKRFAWPDDQGLRAGFTRILPGQAISTFFWYKEIWYMIEGSARLDVVDKRNGKEQTIRLAPRGAVYYPEGVRITLTNDTDEDLLFLYCAVPASKRDASWLGVMDEEDINDVKIREEF